MNDLDIEDIEDFRDESEPKAPKGKKAAAKEDKKNAKGNPEKPKKKKGEPENLEPRLVDKDAEGNFILEPGPNRLKGYVNENYVLFPCGFKGKDFHISWKGNVVMNRCPECKAHQPVNEAIKGVCFILECGYSPVPEIEAVEL